MFVCHDPSTAFGYDANEADLDRDRRMVNDKEGITGRLLAKAIAKGKLIDKVYSMLHEGSREASGIYSYDIQADVMVDKFFEQYGVGAVPCETEEQVVTLGHLGKRGVKLPYNLRTILYSKLGLPFEAIKSLRTGIKHQYINTELDYNELANLQKGIEMLKSALIAAGLNENINVQVVDFADPMLNGIFDHRDVSIQASRAVLSTLPKTLRLLIHEAAHLAGNDGTKQHEAAIGELTEKVFEQFLNKGN